MSIDISKSCSDIIRSNYAGLTGGKMKASHAREMVAAIFGYKSHVALISESAYPLESLQSAKYLAPDLTLLDKRRKCLKGLPEDVPSSKELADSVVEHIRAQGYFTGETWLYESLESYVIDVLLHDNDWRMIELLSGVMAETNAYFEEAYYDSAETVDLGDSFEILVDGTYSGTSDPDRMFCGDTIDMKVTVSLSRAAGRNAFSDFDISATGEINDDWVDPEIRFGTR